MGDVLTQEQKQAALMSTLMYFDEMYYEPGKTLAENIDNMRTNHPEEWKAMKTKGHAGLTPAEVECLFAEIEADPKLGNMIVLDINNRDYANNINEIETGSIQGTFVNPDTKEVMIAFKGTNTWEWIDNAKAFEGELSPEQLAAVDYVNGIVEKYNLQDYAIDVTGHSKGGNKAKIVTLMCDFVRDCISFDGQGEAPENLTGVNLENADKIVNICAHNDYVNGWGISVGEKIYVQGDGPNAHNMGAILHLDGNNIFQFNAPMPNNEPSEFTKWAKRVSDDLMKLPPDERAEMAESVMTVVQMCMGLEGVYGGKWPDVATMYADMGATKEGLNKGFDFLIENGHLTEESLAAMKEVHMGQKVDPLISGYIDMLINNGHVTEENIEALNELFKDPITNELAEGAMGTIMGVAQLKDADNILDKQMILGDMAQQVVLGNGVNIAQEVVENTVNSIVDNIDNKVDQHQKGINNIMDFAQDKLGLGNGISGIALDSVQYLVNQGIDAVQNKKDVLIQSGMNVADVGVDIGQAVANWGVDKVQKGIYDLPQVVASGLSAIQGGGMVSGLQGVSIGGSIASGLVGATVSSVIQGISKGGSMAQEMLNSAWEDNGISFEPSTGVPNMMPEQIPNATPGAVIEPIPNAVPGMGTVIPLNMSNEYGSNMTNTMAGYSALINQKKEENAKNSPVNNMQEQGKGKTSASKDDRGI